MVLWVARSGQLRFLAACRILRVRCVVWLKRMQGVARSQWLFRWGRSADAVATRSPPDGLFWHSADSKVEREPVFLGQLDRPLQGSVTRGKPTQGVALGWLGSLFQRLAYRSPSLPICCLPRSGAWVPKQG